MNEITNCKSINTAIRRATKRLKDKAVKNGLYENFGADEYRAIKDKFIDISSYSEEMNINREKLQAFADWSSNYDLVQMRAEGLI